jgi:uncharacterized protein (UPF0254 family)
MIRIATAECFTHGLVGREIHSFSRGYPQTCSWHLDPAIHRLSLVAALFIPTLSGVHHILGITPVPPFEIIDDIKVYDQREDEVMALKLAEAVREIARADIGIGTTAGIGKGGIAIVAKDVKLLTDSGVEADLRSSSHELILRRQEAGIRKTIGVLERCILDEFSAGILGPVVRVS